MPYINRSIYMKKRRFGFTLAELLVVIAIIAVLVAISIPVISNQLEKARNRTDAYNAKVMGEAIQIYFMVNPDKIPALESACKASKGYVQICVGNQNTAIDDVLKPALKEAGLLPVLTKNGNRYALTAQSKIKWIGYYIAVAGPDKNSPEAVRVEYSGIPVGEKNIPYKYYSYHFWPNADITGFNEYARGIQ